MSTIDQLKSEVDRLSSELQQACLEKVQAAEYGLAVLEEKQRLQEQYDELETSLEANKQELECLREVNIQSFCLSTGNLYVLISFIWLRSEFKIVENLTKLYKYLVIE